MRINFEKNTFIKSITGTFKYYLNPSRNRAPGRSTDKKTQKNNAPADQAGALPQGKEPNDKH
jgi:hypothetical protein